MSEEIKQKSKKKKPFLIFLACVAAVFVIMTIANMVSAIMLRSYIRSFDPVEYDESRLVPVFEDGHYTFTTDGDLKIMHLTDIHIGGGIRSYKNDKKTVYEVITMLRAEKPDLVVLGGDNTYCLPQIGFNGGATINNRSAARSVIEIFEHEKVYFTTVFGNHDTEAIDLADRQEIADLYMKDKFKYCIFNEEFTDPDSDTVPSVSNQCIVLKDTTGKITKLIMLIDSNAYINTHFTSTIFARYDTIHDSEIKWAADTIKDMSKKAGLSKGEYIKCIFFMHIPIGEYRAALDDLIEEERDKKGNIEGFKSKTPTDTVFVDGVWGEEKVCYGGLNNSGDPKDQDDFFEVLCEDMGCVDAIFCGHDHTSNATVLYKGVMLSYSYSLDNEAYGNKIMYSGTQRGAQVINIAHDGTFTRRNKNAYLDYGCDPNKFVEVYLDKPLYEDWCRTYEK